jgi:hypothetical protein
MTLVEADLNGLKYGPNVRCSFCTLNSAVIGLALSSVVGAVFVFVFEQRFTLEDAICSHTFAPREALPCV